MLVPVYLAPTFLGLCWDKSESQKINVSHMKKNLYNKTKKDLQNYFNHFTSKQSFFLCVMAPQFSQAPFRNLVVIEFYLEYILGVKFHVSHLDRLR